VETNADVIEVYYLCLVLGFKGKYNISLLSEQLREAVSNVAAQLRRAGRLTPNALSGHWQADDQPEAPRPVGWPLWAKVGAPVLLCLVLFLYALLYVLLQRELTIVR